MGQTLVRRLTLRVSETSTGEHEGQCWASANLHISHGALGCTVG